jgi:glycosyltransferase involved in cell wall biosynthesis
MANPFLRDEDRNFFVDRKWEWDLNYQLGQVNKIQLFVPEGNTGDISDLAPIDQKKIIVHPTGFNWKNGFIRSWFSAISTINKDIEKTDLVQTTCDVVSLTFFIYLSIKRHKNIMIIIDGDTVKFLKLKAESSKTIKDKIMANTYALLIDTMLKYSVKKSKISFVVGDELFDRYGHISKSNVEKIDACWIARKDIMSVESLTAKIDDFKKRPNVRICYASSLTPIKNPMILIEIAQILKDEDINFNMDIFGLGPLRQEMEESVARHGLEKIVRFRGHVMYGQNFFNELARNDVILVPNRGGEQPRIIFDAFANGCIVVGSKIKAFSIVENGKTGILCESLDSREFANAIINLKQGSFPIAEMAAQARQKVTSLVIENQMERRFSSIRKEFDI